MLVDIKLTKRGILTQELQSTPTYPRGFGFGGDGTVDISACANITSSFKDIRPTITIVVANNT